MYSLENTAPGPNHILQKVHVSTQTFLHVQLAKDERMRQGHVHCLHWKGHENQQNRTHGSTWNI